MLSVFIRFVNELGIPEERFVSIKPLDLKTGKLLKRFKSIKFKRHEITDVYIL